MIINLKYSVWPLLLALVLQALLMHHFWQNDKRKFSEWDNPLRLGRLAFALQGIWFGNTVCAILLVAIGESEAFYFVYQWLCLGLIQINLLFAIVMAGEWHLKKYRLMLTFIISAAAGIWLARQNAYLAGIIITSLFVLFIWAHGAYRHARRTRRQRCLFVFSAWLIFVVLLTATPASFSLLVFALGGVGMFVALRYAFFGISTSEGIQLPTTTLFMDTSTISQDDEVIETLEKINKQFQSEAAILGLYDNIFSSSGHFSSLVLEKISLSSLLHCTSVTLTDDVADLCPQFFSELVQCDIAVVIPLVPKNIGKPVAWLLLKKTLQTALAKLTAEALYGELTKKYSGLYVTHTQKYSDQEKEITRLIALSTTLPAEINIIRGNVAGNKRPQIGLYADRLITQGVEDLQKALSQFNKQVVYLGRNRNHIWPLRKTFPGLRYYVGPNSKFFSSKSSIDVLIYDIAHINHADKSMLINWLSKLQNPITIFLIGSKRTSIIQDIEALNKKNKISTHAISSQDYEEVISAISNAGIQSMRATREYSLEAATAEFESKILKQTIALCEGNKTLAARVLGLKAHIFKRRLETFKIDIIDPSSFTVQEIS